MKTEINATRYLKNTQSELKITNLSRVNILFGKNGTGKSTYIRNVYQTQQSDFHLIVPERGGNNMAYQSSIFDQETRDGDRKSVRSKNWDQQYRERAISRTVAITQSVGYKTLKRVEQEDMDASSIESLFKVFLPEINAKFSEDQPYAIEFYTDENTKITDTSILSSGQVEALSLASDIITQAVLWKGENKCILVDEPDAHLHLDLQNRFAIFIDEISTNFGLQFIITTHSQALMAALMNVSDSISIACLDGRSTEIRAIKKDESFNLSNLLSSDLALAKILGRKIVIVEGNDDFLVWNQAARNQNFEDITLIEAGGGDIYQYKKYTEAILNAVSDDPTQLGITLCDRDDKNDASHDSGSLLPVKRLGCYSVENLLLTNEVLTTIKEGVSLNDELDKLEVSEDEKNIIESIKLDKKSTNIPKELLIRIHAAIDEHAITSDWRIRVGKLLGKGRPEGELLDFLGQEIVDYIWGTQDAPRGINHGTS